MLPVDPSPHVEPLNQTVDPSGEVIALFGKRVKMVRIRSAQLGGLVAPGRES